MIDRHWISSRKSLPIWLCLFIMPGCAGDPPVKLYDQDLRYARMLALGEEYEVIKPIEVGVNQSTLALRATRQYGPIDGRHRGYLQPGTRLRVIHVWRASGDGTVNIPLVIPTLRVVPDHRPWALPMMPGDTSRAWSSTPDGRGNVYVIDKAFVRLVPPDQRTPDAEIKPLTHQQEWPQWGRDD